MRVAAVIRAGDAADVAAVTRAARAGGGCTTCVPEIDEILSAMRGEPIAAELRAQNRRICRDETRQRIEASLFGGIARELPPGVEIDLVSVSGLTVDLHLTSEDPSLRAEVADRLQKLVCADLQVLFS